MRAAASGAPFSSPARRSSSNMATAALSQQGTGLRGSVFQTDSERQLRPSWLTGEGGDARKRLNRSSRWHRHQGRRPGTPSGPV